MNPNRRPLTFTRLDEVPREVDRLLAGHTTVGRWSLGQMCHHLTWVIVGSVEGYGSRALPWAVRRTVGPIILGRMLATGRIPEGVWLPQNLQPKPGLDARAEAEALRAAVSLFQAHAGPFAEHPICGKLTRDQWDAVHRIHSAHHLSFARPEPAGAAAGRD